MNQGALAKLDDNAALSDIANGVMLKQIAERHNVSKVAVYKRLSKHPDYHDAMALQAHAFVQDAIAEVRECDNETVNIARARVDAAFKYAKAHNAAYQDHAHIEHSGHVSGPSFTVVIAPQVAPQQPAEIDVSSTQQVADKT